ncbi:MAG: cytidylate kinase family protein [Patescibacteria group bacterium]|nr:cytidylate kinase family protein [Patescibacteria group bacterium]MDD5715585.1 cytidylate kinase family protein [Patescibacteria group bacterium]
MIVSLSGKPGSGKSTVAKRLAAVLGYKRYYVGGMFRDAARQRGMTLIEFLRWGENHGQCDREFDTKVEELGRAEDNFVIEGRTAFHFIRHSLKIFLDVSDEEGARRIWSALQTHDGVAHERNEAQNLKSYEDVLRSVKARLISDKIRYQKYYHIDIFDPQHYDLYLNATRMSPEEEFQQVYEFVKKRIEKV